MAWDRSMHIWSGIRLISVMKMNCEHVRHGVQIQLRWFTNSTSRLYLLCLSLLFDLAISILSTISWKPDLRPRTICGSADGAWVGASAASVAWNILFTMLSSSLESPPSFLQKGSYTFGSRVWKWAHRSSGHKFNRDHSDPSATILSSTGNSLLPSTVLTWVGSTWWKQETVCK